MGLTPLGSRLQESLQTVYTQLRAALDDARATARDTVGSLRVGFTANTTGPAFNRLVAAFEARYPACPVVLQELPLADPFGPLDRNEVEVLVFWFAPRTPELTLGPLIDRQDRVLAVAARDPLATRETVSVEDLGGRDVGLLPSTLPRVFVDCVLPPTTPSGRPIPRTYPVRTMSEIWAAVARGHIVHPTVASMAAQLPSGDLAFLPVEDLPPAHLWLIWRRAHENGRIRALAELAEGLPAGGRVRAWDRPRRQPRGGPQPLGQVDGTAP